MTIDVAVIGGGISGLATASELKSKGLSVRVLERQVRAGGNAVSERIDGFLMDHGPTTVNAALPIGHEYSARLGLDDQKCDLTDAVKTRYLVGKGAMHGISTHPMGFLKSNYLSIPARLRVMMEPLIRPGSADLEETVHEFVSRRFGKQFSERVFDPMAGGMFAGRAKELSVGAVFPRFLDLEQNFGSIVRGIVKSRGGPMPGSRLFSWAEGIGALPTAMASTLGSDVRTGIAVRNVVRDRNGFDINLGAEGCLQARAVVVATQPHVASQLLEKTNLETAEAVAAISAPPLSVVFLGYRRDQVSHPLDGVGYLTAEKERRTLNGAQFPSTMFAGRAPEGFVSILGYIGGARNPALAKLPERDLIDLTQKEFEDLLGVRGAPVVARVRQWPLGLPQYRIGHQKITRTLESAGERTPGLFLTGNYLHGVSVGNCLEQARQTSEGVAEFLGNATLTRLMSEAV